MAPLPDERPDELVFATCHQHFHQAGKLFVDVQFYLQELFFSYDYILFYYLSRICLIFHQ